MKRVFGLVKEKNYFVLAIEGHFEGSGDYWKQNIQFDTKEEINTYLEKEKYDNYEIYEVAVKKIK